MSREFKIGDWVTLNRDIYGVSYADSYKYCKCIITKIENNGIYHLSITEDNLYYQRGSIQKFRPEHLELVKKKSKIINRFYKGF